MLAESDSIAASVLTLVKYGTNRPRDCNAIYVELSVLDVDGDRLNGIIPLQEAIEIRIKMSMYDAVLIRGHIRYISLSNASQMHIHLLLVRFNAFMTQIRPKLSQS